LLVAMFVAAGCATKAKQYPPWWWTPDSRVEAMLELAGVTDKDVVYDLGSGDGRIVIAAAKKYGARGVGIEINPELVRLSEQKAREAQVSDRVRFDLEDFWHADISDASVVTMYLFEETNEMLKPILIEQLDRDARILTYRYKIPGWTPKKSKRGFWGTVYLYTLPKKDDTKLAKVESN
jgi:SAM-dependent methyltransferase